MVLSLRPGDDRATSLRMARFDHNLPGKRRGLAGPMAQAEALGEAKCWLRELRDDEAGVAYEALNRGEVRPLVLRELSAATRPAPAALKPAGQRRDAPPGYWAAFVLIGDPG
jgi:CHAT domain-containing protein